MDRNCYYSYYLMEISPLKDNRALVSTCFSNTFRPENRLTIEKDIKDTWNSRQFQFQRKLLLRKDWSFCLGSDCFTGPSDETIKRLVNEEEVKNAIAEGKTRLNYLPKMIIMAISFACNNNCYFCNNPKKTPRKEFKVTQLGDNLLKEIKEEIIPFVEQVTLTGGEPFLANPEFIDWFISHHQEKILTVVTNGTLLHRFGLEKIIQHHIGLIISFYAMNKKTYREVTGTNNFAAMFDNTNELMRLGYKHMRLVFTLCRRSIADLDEFCQFVLKNRDNIREAIVQNDCFEGEESHRQMRKLEFKYSPLFPDNKLIFKYRNQGVLHRVIRRFYNPCYSLRYFLGR